MYEGSPKVGRETPLFTETLFTKAKRWEQRKVAQEGKENKCGTYKQWSIFWLKMEKNQIHAIISVNSEDIMLY